MLLKSILLLYTCTSLCLGDSDGVVRYDYYTAQEATDEQVAFYTSINQLNNCTIEIALPCGENEWRRIDGSCNNLKHVSRGTFFNPMYRMLPASFHEGVEPRLAVSGKKLPRERDVRLQFVPTGKSRNTDFTITMPGYGIFMYGDTGSVHDIENYIIHHRYCCEPEHMNDHVCVPNLLADDDPFHRLDGIRCMNMTRAMTYQDFQCTKDPVPAPIAQATLAFDLSQIYNQMNQGDKPMRSFSGGELSVEEENGKIWPPNGPRTPCLLNEPDETRCFKFHRNALLPIQLFTIWFVRQHNYFAQELAKVNPCWDDETLFQTARDINIAFSQQMLIYEWLVALIGYENLLKSGVIYDHPGFRDIYDPNLYPLISLEYTYTLRWFHLMQETEGKMYDLNRKYVKSFPINDLSFRTGFLAKDNNMDYFTQGSYIQPASNWDSLDPDMAERGLGILQKALDTATSDLNKGRYFGVAPYVDYVEYCMGINITSFEDLVKYGLLTPEKAMIASDVYEDRRNMDLLAGLWIENEMEGGKMPATLACIFIDNFLRAIKSDRHHYENPNRSHAFTEAQLKEVRKSKMALMMCTVADNVSEIQPEAFRLISPENPLTPCEDIPHFDFTAWASCEDKQQEQNCKVNTN